MAKTGVHTQVFCPQIECSLCFLPAEPQSWIPPLLTSQFLGAQCPQSTWLQSLFRCLHSISGLTPVNSPNYSQRHLPKFKSDNLLSQASKYFSLFLNAELTSNQCLHGLSGLNPFLFRVGGYCLHARQAPVLYDHHANSSWTTSPPLSPG